MSDNPPNPPACDDRPPRFQYHLRTLLILPIFVALSIVAYQYFNVAALPCVLSFWAGLIGAIFTYYSGHRKSGDVFYAALLGAIVGVIIFLNREDYFIYIFIPKKWHIIRPGYDIVNGIRYIIILSLIFSPLLPCAVAFFMFFQKSKPKI
jgi:hypothetical protein